MRAIVWLGFVLVAAVWTGLSGLLASSAEWLSGALASGQVSGQMSGQISDTLQLAGQTPIPAWLAPWVDAGLLQTLQAGLVWAVQLVQPVLPASATLIGWLTPVIWAVWGLGMLTMLVLAGGLHWLIGRAAGQLPAGWQAGTAAGQSRRS